MDNSTKLDAINTVLTSIANTTTNDYGTVALMVYQIYPKKIYYPLSARTNYIGTEYVVMGARLGLDLSLSNFIIGGPARDFTIEYLVSGQIGKKVDFDIISSNGDLVLLKEITINFPVSINIRNINRIAWSDSSFNNNIPSTVDLAVRPSSGSQVYHSCIRSGGCGTAIITIPNGYIGVISNIGIYSDSTSDVISMIVKDKNNNVLTTRYMTGANTLDGRYNSMGSFNYPLYPGQSVFFASLFGTTVEKFVHGLVTLTAI